MNLNRLGDTKNIWNRKKTNDYNNEMERASIKCANNRYTPTYLSTSGNL